MYVTMRGEIYPCLGLVGCRSFLLGSIEQAPETYNFTQPEFQSLLDVLATSGPKLTLGSDTHRFPALNPVCAAHRNMILAKGAKRTPSHSEVIDV
jgi:hypothetical protein